MDISIGILTYNHAAFIEKLLSGIVNQSTEYSFEIIINDDYSSDSTVEIIKSFKTSYPDIDIHLIENEKNSGQLNGIKNILKNGKGKYLILQDGDDYWTYDGKLQSQVDFLENNPEYIATFHDAKIERIESAETNNIDQLQTKKHYKFISQFTHYRSAEISNWDLMMGVAYIQNCTLMIRRFDITKYMHLFEKVKYNLDWIIGVVLSIEGKIHYINEPWSVYTDHHSGRSKNNYFYDYFSHKIITLKQLSKLRKYKEFRNKKEIYFLLSQQYNYLLENASGGQKTKKDILVWMIQFLKYHTLSSLAQLSYFWHKRKNFIKR